MSVATVRELWRYPVKSMQGERCSSLNLEAGELSARGFAGDRRWSLVDPASGAALSAKTVSQLLFASARIEGADTVITLPNDSELIAGEPSAAGALSAWLGRDVDLTHVENQVRSSYEMTFDPPNDAAELFTIPTPDGTFFDLTPVHLMSTGSLATMAAAHPSGAWEVRRFRPNIVVEVHETHEVRPHAAYPEDAYPEDAWVDHALEVGTDGAVIKVLMRTVRCAMPLRAQPGLDRDVDIYRTMAEHHENHLGVYCEPMHAGGINEGDALILVAEG